MYKLPGDGIRPFARISHKGQRSDLYPRVIAMLLYASNGHSCDHLAASKATNYMDSDYTCLRRPGAAPSIAALGMDAARIDSRGGDIRLAFLADSS